MFSPSDTIVALATAPAPAGIGVVRLSGPQAAAIAREMLTLSHDLEPRHATLTHVVASRLHSGDTARPIDEVVATFFPGPHSYTAEDVVEISAHGSLELLREIVAAAMSQGARLAEPGEFTLRAFLNGRLDLVQAEAVGDLVNAVTPLQARVAFDQLDGTLTRAIGALDGQLFDLVGKLEASVDFPDEGYHFVAAGEVEAALVSVREGVAQLLATAARGRLIREGRHIAILGRPNVGKSSLFNALVGTDRAIVTAIPGTTRDLLRETIDFEGVRLGLVDTAGIRHTDDEVEREGVARARGAGGVADLVLLVLDRSRPLAEEDRALLRDTAGAPRLVIVNKCDLPGAWADGNAAGVRVGGDAAGAWGLGDVFGGPGPARSTQDQESNPRTARRAGDGAAARCRALAARGLGDVLGGPGPARSTENEEWDTPASPAAPAPPFPPPPPAPTCIGGGIGGDTSIAWRVAETGGPAEAMLRLGLSPTGPAGGLSPTGLDRVGPGPVEVSVKTFAGMDALRRAMGEALGISVDPGTPGASGERATRGEFGASRAPGRPTAEPLRDAPMISNLRHAALLEEARASLDRAIANLRAAGEQASEELVIADLADARRAFEDVTGRRTSEDVLRHIFANFCIGK